MYDVMTVNCKVLCIIQQQQCQYCFLLFIACVTVVEYYWRYLLFKSWLFIHWY